MVRISRFTPWQTSREQLEAIFVARESILKDLTTRALRVIDFESRIHTLVVGPRGSGKTHLLAMLFYKLQDAIADSKKLQVARLPEDPITVVTYPRLLAAIMKSIRPDYDCTLNSETLEFELDKAASESGPIVVLIENLDEVFIQIEVDGQRKLRHYLQTSNSLLLIATTSVLDRSMSEQNSPFYSFFSIIHLQPFTETQAHEMLIKLANVRDDEKLVEYLEDDMVKRRLNIVSHIAGSHPRIWSIFSEVMTPGSLQNITELLYESFDDLTPYYVDRLKSLNPQQRLVISELAEANHPLHVQEIARRIQLDQRSVSRTVLELRNAGWVTPVETSWVKLLDGRRTYYELFEPLSRLAFQAKEAIGRPIDLIVSFLSVWFDPDEVASWGGRGFSTDYVEQVINTFESDTALRLTRRLTRLPSSKASDVALLGDVDNAIAQLQAGDAQAIMSLPSQVRATIEQQWLDKNSEEENGFVLLRRELHKAAMSYMGWVAHEPESSKWIARAENLAETSGADEDLSIWIEWLARSWFFSQAETALLLINNDKWRLNSQNSIANGYLSAGRFNEAIQLHEQNLADSIHILGEDHADTLTCRNDLACSYWSAGRYNEAIQLDEQNLADRMRILGENHPDTLKSRGNLASGYQSVERYDEAIQLHEQNLADRVRILGEDHPDTLKSRGNLASGYQSVERYDEAIQLHEQTLADSIRILGEDHPDTLICRNSLANSYRSVGRYDEAIQLHEQTLTDSIRILGEDHPNTLISRNNLAYCYRMVGRKEDTQHFTSQTDTAEGA